MSPAERRVFGKEYLVFFSFSVFPGCPRLDSGSGHLGFLAITGIHRLPMRFATVIIIFMVGAVMTFSSAAGRALPPTQVMLLLWLLLLFTL
ncbi:Hypothetical protein NTJ_04135 [Nesidiocoris tenuis]|uniref:Uncharacterized protein n=1 Tax=Nesidiocoris tenuis TaxID=355587 RepID=A0ABN7ALV8_9HEMI|nr:Hypothetical protein NTJ_04135 [Nesidiocoris tenuis]